VVVTAAAVIINRDAIVAVNYAGGGAGAVNFEILSPFNFSNNKIVCQDTTSSFWLCASVCNVPVVR